MYGEMKNLLIVGPEHGYSRPWVESGMFRFVGEDEATPGNQPDVVLFTGGADISPEVYGRKNYGHSYTSWASRARDMFEVAAFHKWVARGVPLIGICRGAQLFTGLTGGSLYQDVGDWHQEGDHQIITDDGRKMMYSSVHHQMMIPNKNKPYKLIAWSECLSYRYVHELKADAVEKHELGVDPEIIYYPEIKALAIQGHPEYMPTNSRGNVYTRELVEQYLLDVTGG